MLTKSGLKGLFLSNGFRPLKRLGENYLIDANIKDKIIGEVRARLTAKPWAAGSDTIIEIGPGFGALTVDLARSGARVVAVEKDKKAYAILKCLVKDIPNLELYNEDILKFDLGSIPRSGKLKVIGNLPYYITTPIIEYLIDNRPLIESAFITVQREVADRLLASPGSKTYGSISCFVQYYTKPSYLFTIKRTCFYPSPEVDSSFIRLDFFASPSVEAEDEELLFKVIRGAFNQRRKSIINSLSREAVLDMSKEALSKVLRSIGIDPEARPESLGLAEFAKIANALA